MLKNNKGITLTILVVTILVILILASITITSADTVLTKTRIQNATTNMKLLNSKIVALYEQYDFNLTPESSYIGTKCEHPDELNVYGVIVSEDDKWYIINRNDLPSLGFDIELLKEVTDDPTKIPELQQEKYIVNYVSGEIIYTTGVQDENNERIYTLTGLMELYSGDDEDTSGDTSSVETTGGETASGNTTSDDTSGSI